jgi:hypothetical protein
MSDDKSKAPRVKVPSAVTTPNSNAVSANSVASAAKAATDMEHATALLNATLGSAERKFADLGLGVTAKVELWFDKKDKRGEFLRFGKDGKEWRLLVELSSQDLSEDGTTTPLLSSSREIRALALRRLPALFDALVVEAQMRARILTSDAQAAIDFLSSLGTK